MKKLLVITILLIAVIVSGCGDKFAKEKEAITKAEQAAMAMKLPDISEPDYSKKPSKEDWEKYHKNLKEFIEIETKMLAEMKKSDAKIAEMEKTASESEKKDLKAFKDKMQQERIAFVRKVSKGRLSGDTFIVGVGSTWQEIEMVYGQPKTKKSDYDYEYEGIAFSDWYSKGVPPKGYKFVSNSPQAVMVTSNKYMSDAGVKIGMTKDEFYKALNSFKDSIGTLVEQYENGDTENGLSGEYINSIGYGGVYGIDTSDAINIGFFGSNGNGGSY